MLELEVPVAVAGDGVDQAHPQGKGGEGARVRGQGGDKVVAPWQRVWHGDCGIHGGNWCKKIMVSECLPQSIISDNLHQIKHKSTNIGRIRVLSYFDRLFSFQFVFMLALASSNVPFWSQYKYSFGSI